MSRKGNYISLHDNVYQLTDLQKEKLDLLIDKLKNTDFNSDDYFEVDFEVNEYVNKICSTKTPILNILYTFTEQ